MLWWLVCSCWDTICMHANKHYSEPVTTPITLCRCSIWGWHDTSTASTCKKQEATHWSLLDSQVPCPCRDAVSEHNTPRCYMEKPSNTSGMAAFPGVKPHVQVHCRPTLLALVMTQQMGLVWQPACLGRAVYISLQSVTRHDTPPGTES